MIKTTFNILEYSEIKPVNDPTVFDTVIPPLERLKSISHEDFEAFIAEWVISCVKTIYKDVYRIGGSGDMGRDVIAEYESGEFDYYQCKRYEKKLTPSEYWIEFGKLCYYTFNNDIPRPKKYYIIASQGIGSKMMRLINNSDGIRNELKKNWKEKCETKIIQGKAIKLEGDLERYIDSFDFTIVDYYSIEKIIEEHRQTDYFYFRFGGNIKPIRTIKINPQDKIDTSETRYIKKIIEAYSENKNKEINLNELDLFPDLLKHFKRQREYFYSAESLKRCIRDIFTNEDEFKLLQDEMYDGLIDYIEDQFEDGYDRMKKTIHEAGKVNLSISSIDRELNFVRNADKKGICHHLANDDRITWKEE